jgi:hypothetical protein
MEEYKLKLNIGEFKLLIGEEKPFYKTEGINQMIDLYWDGTTIYNSSFGRYDLLDKINSEVDNYIELLDFWTELPSIVIIKELKEITISKNGFDHQRLDGEYYDQFMNWLIYGLKTVDMKRKEKIELLKERLV